MGFSRAAAWRIAGAVMVAAIATAMVSAARAADLDAVIGRALFERMWAAGGASTQSADGLGPLHNARSCAGCHRAGGPSRLVEAPDGTITGPGMLVRVVGAGEGGDPVYGHQIQPMALAGLAPEARVTFGTVPPAPGEAGPRVAVVMSDLAFGPLAPDTRFGIRVGPSLRGRAALDRIDEAAVAALADPEDRDGDGISGREQRLADGHGGSVLGRYGWRAAQATLHDQVATALSLDLGLSSPTLPAGAGDCTAAEAACRASHHGDHDAMAETEVTAQMIDLMAAYLDNLPAHPLGGEAGLQVFAASGCAACHVAEMPAKGGGKVVAFTDLLLHDLGPGLADAAVEGTAAPSEWRTAPLVGLGQGVSGERRFLHDGRAASVDEAIRWHGGEASAAKMRYEHLSPSDRAALIAFLEGL